MTEGRRRVVLGISGHRTTHLLDWAVRLLRPGDQVQIVHVYCPIPYAATDWQLPLDHFGPLHDLTRRQLVAAAARLRRSRPDLTVTEELTGGAIDTALTEAARIADLIVLGIPHGDRNRAMLDRLLAEIDCPVILIGPAEAATIEAVAAVLQGGPADDVVLREAFGQAQREHCGLLALKRWQPPLDGSARYAETAEQKTLDGYLASWQLRYPQVGVTAELRFGESLPELTEHGADAGLLVLPLPRPGTDRHGFEKTLAEVLADRDRPTMLVPERLIPQRKLATVGAQTPFGGPATDERRDG